MKRSIVNEHPWAARNLYNAFLESKRRSIERILDPARATLRSQPYLAGAAPAYADYILFSPLQWGRITSTFELLDPDDKAMRDWRERMLDLFDGLARREPARAS